MFYVIMLSVESRHALISNLASFWDSARVSLSAVASIPDGSAIWQMPGRLSCHGRFGEPPAASPIFHRREQLGTGADN